jgi:hypothetical protein
MRKRTCGVITLEQFRRANSVNVKKKGIERAITLE